MELMKAKVGREKVWCTTLKTEGHVSIECLLLRGGVARGTPMGPPLVRPTKGIS